MSGRWVRDSRAVVLRERLEAVVKGFGERHQLTARERDVLVHGAMGRHTKGIAADLSCSPKTVEEYWRRLIRKARVDSRGAIIAEVLAEALLDWHGDGWDSQQARPAARASRDNT
jgi:DNA-binding CsgD family transcriptional regulator